MELSMDELQKATMDMAAAILEPNGYRLNKFLKTCYEKRGNEVSHRVQFEFKVRSSMVRCSKQLITFHKVENVIMEVDLPNRDLDLARKGKVLIPTIEDNSSPVDYNMEEQIFTQEEGQLWCAAVEKYLKNEGKVFVEQYRTLPALLTTMDQLHTTGKKWFELLSGGPDYFFRGLIISKLCNDPHYQDKIAEGNNQFIRDVGEEWVP